MFCYIPGTHAAFGQFVVLSKCVCSGRELRLQCTVEGGGITEWTGTAFDCPVENNKITLRHFHFESGGAIGVCNNGTIIGRSLNRTLSFDGLKFIHTSQLTIWLPLQSDMNDTLEGKTVGCIYDDGATTTTISTYTVAYTRDGM